MSHATIDELRSHLDGSPVITPEYAAKMLHRIPEAKEIDRMKWILERCKGKCVMEFGASGRLHQDLAQVVKSLVPIDKAPETDVMPFDLDDVSQSDLPPGQPDLILCGEILEHLANPGWFLERIKRQFPGIPMIVTVPNAFAKGGRGFLRKGVENVNKDHVAWYSPITLQALLGRYGFTIKERYWYNGNDPKAEGIVVVAE